MEDFIATLTEGTADMGKFSLIYDSRSPLPLTCNAVCVTPCRYDPWSVHWLHSADLHNGSVERSRWLLNICLVHPNCVEPDPSVLVVRRALQFGHSGGGLRHDHLPTGPAFHVGQNIEHTQEE